MGGGASKRRCYVKMCVKLGVEKGERNKKLVVLTMAFFRSMVDMVKLGVKAYGKVRQEHLNYLKNPHLRPTYQSKQTANSKTKLPPILPLLRKGPPEIPPPAPPPVRQKATDTFSVGMSVDEAKKILSLEGVTTYTKEDVETLYKQLWEINEPAKGGSEYIRQKVDTAKKTLEMDLKKLKSAPQQQQQQNQQPQPQPQQTNTQQQNAQQ